ncbi:hypothetical protein SAMN02745166_04913 [Prosthecobacter debontii]|uniref:Uncharacterized protein n=2 Tax=Prosthecobacter debontii TaxID=48467 RepID=A0A1T4Z3C3_9BACT|nr:hypothetical protein SAMN02745166_04913 [Prosthecobacter debontii]
MTQEEIQGKAKAIATQLINDVWDQSDKPDFNMNTPEGAVAAIKKNIGDFAPQANKNIVDKSTLLKAIDKELDLQVGSQLLMQTNDPADDMRRGQAAAQLKEGIKKTRDGLMQEFQHQQQRGHDIGMGSQRR